MSNIFRKFCCIISPHNRGERIFMRMLGALKVESKVNPCTLAVSVLNSLAPGLKLTPRLKSGKPFDFPIYLSNFRAQTYAIEWLHKTAQERNRKITLPDQLKDNMIDV